LLLGLINNGPEVDIDWKNEQSIITLNKAILSHYLHIQYWAIPPNTLIPRIPMRANYLKWVYSLQHFQDPTVLDIGVGANAIFPLLGHQLYQWKFVCTEINQESIANAEKIIKSNSFENDITIRKQTDVKCILKNIIKSEDRFGYSICNPPFFSRKEEKTHPSPFTCCPISENEECYEGGELGFISKYIMESIEYKKQVIWFTCMIGRKLHVDNVCTYLEELGCSLKYTSTTFKQGRNRRWGIAWSFENEEPLMKHKKIEE